MTSGKHDRRRSHLELSSQLRDAIASHDLTLVYHPIHAIDSGRIVSAEALMRWRRGARDEAPIEAMADAAERGEAAFDLAEWVAVTAHKDASTWRAADPSVRVNLNVSARYLGERDLESFVRTLTERGVMEPRSVNLEITEKSFVRRPATVTRMLENVRKTGAQLWLDDFGSGHSSIEHLRHFPVDGLKIPGIYTRDMATNKRALAICRGVVALAKELGIRVVAEGVESDEQLELLRQMGCDEIQGFIFSKPMSPESLRDMLHER